MQSWSETSSHNCFNPHVVAILSFFFNFIIDILKSEQCGNLSLSHRLRSTSLAVCRAGGSHVPIDIDRTEQFRRRNARVGEISKSDRGLKAGATRTDDDRCRRRGGGGGGGDGDGDGHHRVCRRRSAMRHSTHNTRCTFPQHDAAATNVPTRSFVASHRAAVPTSPSLFSTVAYGRCRPARIDICMWFDVGRQRRSRRPGSRRGESPRRGSEPTISTRSRYPPTDRSPCLSGNLSENSLAGEVASAFLERRNGGEKKKIGKRKKFSWDSDWIDLGKWDFAPDRFLLQGCDRKAGDFSRNFNPLKNLSRANTWKIFEVRL